MRPLELAGFISAALPVLALISVVPRAVGIGCAALACVILAIAAVRLGPYWQLVPLYLGAALNLTALLSLSQHPRWMRAATAATVACLLALTAAFTYILPMFRLPLPTGKYAIGTRIVYLVDPVRKETHVSGPAHPSRSHGANLVSGQPGRPTSCRLSQATRNHPAVQLHGCFWTHSYLNAPVSAEGGPFPVLLFNPAWKGQRTQNTYQVEDLASHGFIVVAIDHSYNSGPVAFPDGRIIRTRDIHDITHFEHTTVDQQIAIGDREVRIQAGDNSLVLDYLAAAGLDPLTPWFHRVDADNAGVFGHSFGGAVAAQTCYQDPRVKAAINEDGWMFGDVPAHGLDKPFLVMVEESPPTTQADLQSSDVQTRREAELDVIDGKNLDRTMHRYGGYHLTILGSRHNDFRDRVLYSPLRRLTESGTISPQLAHQIVENYTLQFFSHYLLERPAPLLIANGNPYKEVQFENWFAQNALTH